MCYNNRFVSIATIKNRKVTHWRDYLDPVAVFNASGWPEGRRYERHPRRGRGRFVRARRTCSRRSSSSSATSDSPRAGPVLYLLLFGPLLKPLMGQFGASNYLQFCWAREFPRLVRGEVGQASGDAFGVRAHSDVLVDL